MDAVRVVILVLLFAGLLAAWIWSKRQAKLAGPALRSGHGSTFKVTQKRWLDKGTGVCLVESGTQTFLLAYTAGGGVSWQPLAKKTSDESVRAPLADLEPMEDFEKLLSVASLQ